MTQDPTMKACVNLFNSVIRTIKLRLNTDKIEYEIQREKEISENNKKGEKTLLQPPKSILSKDFKKGEALQNLFSIDSEEIARQMTLFDWKLFIKISNSELIDLSWLKEEKLTCSPNGIFVSLRLFKRRILVNLLIVSFNQFSDGYADEI
jgi:hypothetical protein